MYIHKNKKTVSEYDQEIPQSQTADKSDFVNPDFVIDDNPCHMNALPNDYIPDNSMPCCSEYKGHVNYNGLLRFDLCKQIGLRMMNGRVGKDSGVGKYTFLGSRGRSLVDYI